MLRIALGVAVVIAAMPLSAYAQFKDDFEAYRGTQPVSFSDPVNIDSEAQFNDQQYARDLQIESAQTTSEQEELGWQEFTLPEQAVEPQTEIPKPQLTESDAVQHAVPNPYEVQQPPIRRVSWFGKWFDNHESGDHCTDAACESEGECNDACSTSCCYDRMWEHRSGLYGQFLYLHARDVDLPYATNVDGNILNATPLAPTQSADPDHQPGFKVGFAYALDNRSSITANYAFFESDTDDVTGAPANGFIRPELVIPSTLNTFGTAIGADANYRIDYQMVDVNYKSLVYRSCSSYVNAELGFRYANLDQDTLVGYDLPGQRFEVASEIDFDGYGPRLGFEASRYLGRRGLSVYANGAASLLAGEFTSNYRQRDVNLAVNQGSAGFDDDRIVPQLEYEMGFSWTSCTGRFNLKAGYYIGAWFNTVTTPDFIRASQLVQTNNVYDQVDDTLTFDGLTASAEVRF